MAAGALGKSAFTPPTPPSLTEQQLMQLEEQNRLENTRRTGKGNKFTALKAVASKFVYTAIPNPAIMPKQANVATILAAYVANAVQHVKKPQKKDPIDEVMESVEECLDGILKDEVPASGKHASKVEEFRQLFSTLRHYYELLEKQAKTEEELVAFTDALYNRISQNKYTQLGVDLRETLFELPPNVFYSEKTSLLNELVFNFVIHILIHPKQRLTPLRSIMKSLSPKGLPDIARKLNTFPEAEQSQILLQIIELGPEIPFNKALPKILGKEGIDVIAQWTLDFLIKYSDLDSNVPHIEKLVTLFGPPFTDAIRRGGFLLSTEDTQ